MAVLSGKVPGVCEVQVPGVVGRRAALRQDRKGRMGAEANQGHWLRLGNLLLFLKMGFFTIGRSRSAPSSEEELEPGISFVKSISEQSSLSHCPAVSFPFVS